MRALLAIVPLMACGGEGSGGDGGVGSNGGAAAHQACLVETNRYRTQLGKVPVSHSQALEDYADQGAGVDFTSSPHHHFSSTQGGGIALAENECPQQGGWELAPGGDLSALVGQCIAAFFAEGPGGGHYENMMGPYGKLGCGIHQEGTRVTILQDFGS